jgi:hypothetical protein
MLPALALSLATSSAFALDPIPDETGFSGTFGLGAAGGSVESNFLAEIWGIELSKEDINQYDSPNDTTIIIPSFDFRVNYVFSNKKTMVHLGDAVENSIDFSTNTALGIRHDFSALGSIELAALLPTPGVKVYEDPYLLGEDRDDTDRDSTGGQITWDQMFGTGLELIASTRDIDIEDERSGNSLGLSGADKDLLDREGDVHRVELGYMFGGADLKVRPHAAWIDRDLDGDAMAQDGYELGVTLLYHGNGYTWLNRLAYQDLDGDKENPIFNKANDADVYSFASELAIPEPFGWEKWYTTVGVSWGENQADIDFNDSSVAIFAARLNRRF